MTTIKHIDRWDVVTDDNFVLYCAKTEQEAKDYLEGWYKKTYLGQDYFGNNLYIGDKVVFMQVGYREFIRGTLISGGKVKGTIAPEDREHCRAHYIQFYKQMIKVIE